MFKSKSLAEATPDEIRYFATSFLGIPTDGLEDSEVLAKLRAANGNSENIFVREGETPPVDQTGSPPPAPEESVDGALRGSLGHTDPKVQLTIHAEERDGITTTRHKEVGVNGVVWLLKRGESITIPYRVYEALQNAEREVISHDKDGNPISQRAMATPFNVEVLPPAAEIAAWKARTQDRFVP